MTDTAKSNPNGFFTDKERWERYNPADMPDLRSAIATDWPPDKKIVRGYRAQDLITNCSFTDAFFLVLFGRLPNEKESKMFGAVMVTHITGTFMASENLAARYIISTNTDQHSAVAGGLLALGFIHGGATDYCAEFIKESVERMQSEGSTHEAMAKIRVDEYLADHRRIPGIGHAYFNTFDPRCRAIIDMAKELGFYGDHIQLYLKVAEVFPKDKAVNMVLNPEGCNSAIMMDMLGDEHDTRATDLWHLLSRAGGICGHVLEAMQRDDRRKSRRLPWTYDGHAERDVPDDYLAWRR